MVCWLKPYVPSEQGRRKGEMRLEMYKAIDWVWWPMPVTPKLGRMRQVQCCGFQVSLDYTVSSRTA